MVVFFLWPGFTGARITRWKWKWYHSPLPHSKIFPSCSYDIVLCLPRGLCSKGRDASTRKYVTDSIELGVKIATQPLWSPDISQSKGKEGSYGVTGMTDHVYQGILNCYSTMKIRKNRSRIQEIP